MSGQAVRYVGAGIAALAGLALLISAVLLLTRSEDTAPVTIVAPEAETTAAGKSGADIKVQVSGEVMFPGVYPMNPDDRVIDAIAAAGGASANGDLSGLNLSKRVQDEARYHVPAIGEAAPAVSVAAASAAEDGDGLLNLNTAGARDLETLPGIGPSLANAIVTYREGNGPFAAIDDVENVPGIGPKTLDAIRPLVTVSGSP